jgi:Protein of unknown function (DUF742)
VTGVRIGTSGNGNAVSSDNGYPADGHSADDNPADGPGRVVPVYAVTGGRTRSDSAELPMESLVMATAGPTDGMQAEYQQILEMADRPVSLVEIGSALQIPVGVARVLVSDLAGAGYVAVHRPEATKGDGRPHPAVLERLLEGLRAR